MSKKTNQQKFVSRKRRPNPAKTMLLPRGFQFPLMDLLSCSQFPEPCWVCHACKGILQASVDTGKQMHCPQCQEPMQWYGPKRKFTTPDDAIDVQAEDVTHPRIEQK